MRRIQDYLVVDEINHSVVATINREVSTNAIMVRDSSAFHYGVSKRDEDSIIAPSPMQRRDSIVMDVSGT